MYRQAWDGAGVVGGGISAISRRTEPVRCWAIRSNIAACWRRSRRTVPLRRGQPRLGSIKSNMGHLDNAAGIVGLIKAILAVEHAEIHPMVNFARPNPHMGYRPDILAVADRRTEWVDAGERPLRGRQFVWNQRY